MAGVLTRVLAHRTERDPDSRESGYLPSFVKLQALLRLSRICLSRMESAVSGATFSLASTWRRLAHWSGGAGQADAHVKSRRAEPDHVATVTAIAIQNIASSSIAPVTGRTDRPNPRASTRTAGFRWLCFLPAKTALKNELVKLGIPPSSANEAVNELWERWDKREV